MKTRTANRFVALWRAELKAAEAAVDKITEQAHRMLARKYLVRATAWERSRLARA